VLAAADPRESTGQGQVSADWLRLARIARILSWLTLAWMAVEGGVAIAAAILAAVAEELAGHRLTRVPAAGVNLRRSLRAVWSGGELPPVGAARDPLAHVSVRLPADGIRHG
jgi:hypothetical protein